QSASPDHGDESSSSSRRSAYSSSWDGGREELNFSSGSDESPPDMDVSDTSGSTRAESVDAEDPCATFLLDNDSLLERCLAEFGSATLPNSTTTKAAAVAMLMSIVSANSLTWTLLEQLLGFVDMLFGATAHVLPRSKYLFRKLWYSRTSAVAKKYPYCESCTGLLESSTTSGLICAACNISYNEETVLKAGSYFTILDVGEQLKHVISKEKKELSENIGKIEAALSQPEVTDVTTASSYRCLKQDGVLKKGDLTLIVNTDGSPVFKSSRSSIWPVQFSVSELPPKIRFTSTTLAGLWFGRKHPNMSVFMKTFAENVVATPPIKWSYEGADYTSRCIRYIYEDNELEPAPERTSAMVLRDTELAEQFMVPVQGVKGPSSLSTVPNFDPVWGYTVDYMHCVLLGATRQVTKTLIASSNFTKTFYIGRPHQLMAINEILLSIRPPYCFTRLPRSLRDHAFWKASEWRHWLLFYSLPCTLDILPPRFWRQLCRLAEAIYLLLLPEINEAQIRRAGSVILRRNPCARASASQRRHVGENPTLYTPASWRNRRDQRRSTQPDHLDAKMEHAVFRAGRASDAGPGCITRWLPAALARKTQRIRAIADDRSTTPCGVMFEESDSVVEKLIEGIRPHQFSHPKIEYDFLDIVKDVSGFLGQYGQFDRVYSFGALQWTDQEVTFKNIEKLLHPGGECLLVYFVWSPSQDWWRKIVQKEPWTKYAKGRPSAAGDAVMAAQAPSCSVQARSRCAMSIHSPPFGQRGSASRRRQWSHTGVRGHGAVLSDAVDDGGD
ncbi:hypothetical protein HPB47_005793, partial [Ixodes persulcatus]